MNNRERNFISAILFGILVMVSLDLAIDSREGIHWWHLLAETSVAIAAMAGIFFLLRASFALKHSLVHEQKKSEKNALEAEKWRATSKKYLEGLSIAIEQQLTRWELSVAEKEVAFLLLKGLSLKEIAQIRNTAEKTARAQSLAVYEKSGLTGRSELAAFFLEDLFLGSNPPPPSE